MEVTELKRVFKHGDNILDDPNREMSSDDVLEFYGNNLLNLQMLT